ncbi:TPA: hypothetical protein DIC40_05080 [Patescibacteria group bacterium]|nr:hypothetical protein P148_SR1C00001G0598 [candidate division SR1 bacterium RAAC1_SR1_1]HCY21193.1 hypothetical protein [Candidatus Gracilibacteria bacterium]
MTETSQKVFTEKELFDRLVTGYLNTSTKVKKIDAENLNFFFEKFKFSQKTSLIIRSDGFAILFEDNVLFLLEPTNSVQHNACSVLRDLINILYDGERHFHRKDIEDIIIFQ